jgi:hypothetical protein
MRHSDHFTQGVAQSDLRHIICTICHGRHRLIARHQTAQINRRASRKDSAMSVVQPAGLDGGGAICPDAERLVDQSTVWRP